jgi:hypothetical protein
VSRAAHYAERYRAALEVEAAAQRAKDGVAKLQFILPPEGPFHFGLNTDRLVARVTTEGTFAYEGGHRLTGPDALRLAAWITEMFTEGA